MVAPPGSPTAAPSHRFPHGFATQAMRFDSTPCAWRANRSARGGRIGCRRCGFWIFTRREACVPALTAGADRLPLSGPALRDARCAGSSGLIGGSAPPPPPLTFARSQAARWLGVGCRRAGGGSARARSVRSQVEGCGRHGPGRGGRVGLRRTEVPAPESGERSEPARLAEPPDRRRPTPPHPARPSRDSAPRVGLTLAAAILPGALERLRTGYSGPPGARDPPFETPAARAPQGYRWWCGFRRVDRCLWGSQG